MQALHFAYIVAGVKNNIATLRYFFQKFMLINVKKVANSKICCIFAVSFENAKFKTANCETTKLGWHNKKGIIGRYSSGSRFTTLLNFANSKRVTVFYFINKVFNPKMRSSVKNVENVNNSSIETGATCQSGENNAHDNGANAYSKTQILSDVMKNAWRFFKMTGTNFSECLQRAWRNYNLTKRMLRGIVHFYFQKVSGEIREAYGTLASDRLPETGDGRKKNDFVQVYYDTEKNEFRSFKKFNLVSIA